MSDELREAADVYFAAVRVIANALAEMAHTSLKPIDIENNAKAILARLAQKNMLVERVEPDDNEPVDNAWLRSILIQGGEFQYHDSMPDFLNLYNDDFDVDIESMKSKPITRGMVRLLLRALQ